MSASKATRERTTTARSDKESAIRDEYRAAGKLDGLVLAWSLVKRLREHYAHGFLQLAEAKLDSHEARAARDAVRIAELMLAREVKRLYPKGGIAELVARGYEDEERKAVK